MANNVALRVMLPLGVVSWTVPVVAPEGTVVMICDGETTVKAAEAPLKLTLVVPVRLVPRILIRAPTLPDPGSVSIKGPRPVSRRKMVPSFLEPPTRVVP